MRLLSEHKKIIGISNRAFNSSARLYKNDNKAVMWYDQQRQYLRFAELIKYLVLDVSDKTVLDVGCGNGELYRFLNFMGFKGQYVGYDINPTLLKQAQKRFPHIKTRRVDIMTERISKRFNYVVMSGLFNYDMGQTASWVHEILKKMFLLCKEAVIFNAISTHVDYKEKGNFYLDPAEILSFCVRYLSPRVVLAHHNPPYSFTMAVYKQTNWKSIND